MSETAPKAELLRSLGRLVRGLSAIFWGLPLALIIYVQTASTHLAELVGAMAFLPPLAVTGLIFYGLTQMGHFQRQERVWMTVLERAKFVTVVNLGLSPFLYWWQRFPTVQLFTAAVGLLTLSSLLLLYYINLVLHRLAAMLPDETLRMETRMFTNLNRSLLVSIPILLASYVLLAWLSVWGPVGLPSSFLDLIVILRPFGLWLILFLILMPLAMTMALIWKIKEVIFASVFDAER
jgi:hypothetical protein